MTKQAELKKQAYESHLKSRALSILIYLIDRSNQDLTCFPAIPTMARDLHISVSTVKRGLKELVNGGYIYKESRFREKNMGQSSNLYTLVIFEKAEKAEEIVQAKAIDDIQKIEVQDKHITFEGIKETIVNHQNAQEKKRVQVAFTFVNNRKQSMKSENQYYISWTGEGVSLIPP